jgi:ketosteroid isomerase-like protein
MNITSFISEWIRLSNAFDTEAYLEKYSEDAVLDDPSVGRKFIGHEGIRDYFISYFIGYNTKTRLVKLDIHENQAHVEVEFTGSFPGEKIGGMFDITFKDGKIATVIADLM